MSHPYYRTLPTTPAGAEAVAAGAANAARADERRAVVAYLRILAEGLMGAVATDLEWAADSIEKGRHVGR
jgi:hypothetical protein